MCRARAAFTHTPKDEHPPRVLDWKARALTSAASSAGLRTQSHSSSSAAGVWVFNTSMVYDICSREALAMMCDPILST